MKISYTIFKFLIDRVFNDAMIRVNRASTGIINNDDYRAGFLAGANSASKTIKDELINYIK